MKRFRLGFFGFCAVVASGLAGVAVAVHFHRPPAAVSPTVQVAIGENFVVMGIMSGGQNRSQRRPLDGRVWDGQARDSFVIRDFIRQCADVQRRFGTYDGRAGIIYDPHTSFALASVVKRSVMASYPQVFEIVAANGIRDVTPPRDSFLKDCSAKPTPAGCMAPKKPK